MFSLLLQRLFPECVPVLLLVAVPLGEVAKMGMMR